MKYKKMDYLFYLITLLTFTIAISVFCFSLNNYNRANEKIVDFDNKNIDSIYLRVSDIYDTENEKTLKEFFEEKDSLERMKKFSSKINKDFEYLEFDTQSLLIEDDTKYEDKFRVDYGTEYFGENDKSGVCLLSAQIGARAYEFFNIDNNIVYGKGFKDNFVYNGKSIPAILGYEYLDLFELGDKMKFNYLTKSIEIEVVGFLAQNTSLSINNNTYFLDRFIVIPSLEIDELPTNPDDIAFQKILYSIKNWGYIHVADGDSYYSLKNKIDELSNQLNLEYILNEGHVSPYINNISNTLGSSKGLLLILSVLLLITLVVVFGCLHCWDFNRKKTIYAIHLVCGCNFHRLRIMIWVNVITQAIISFAASGLVNYILLGRNGKYLSEVIQFEKTMQYTLVITGVIIFVICVVLDSFLKRSDIYKELREDK